MLVEIDEIAVSSEELARARAGDLIARGRLRKTLCGVVLYCHNLTVNDRTGWSIISLREANELGIVSAVIIEAS